MVGWADPWVWHSLVSILFVVLKVFLPNQTWYPAKHPIAPANTLS